MVDGRGPILPRTRSDIILGDGTEKVFLRAKDASECGSDRFLLDEATRRVSLCDAACAIAKADAKATLTVLSGCDPKLY